MKGFWIAFLFLGLTPFFGYVGPGAAAIVFTVSLFIGMVSVIISSNDFDENQIGG